MVCCARINMTMRGSYYYYEYSPATFQVLIHGGWECQITPCKTALKPGGQYPRSPRAPCPGVIQDVPFSPGSALWSSSGALYVQGLLGLRMVSSGFCLVF